MTQRSRQSTHAKGRRGEDTAVRFLTDQGYDILHRNVHTAYGELDCVARDGDTLVFVEVKTRRTEAFGDPQEAVTDTKRARLCRSAAIYLQDHPHEGPCRFDVVSIGSDARIRHIPDAFTCEETLL